MDPREIKPLIENFLETLEMEGICGFFIDDEEHEDMWVYVVLDKKWVNSSTKPGFIANRIRLGVKEEIKKYLGVDVSVGSIAKNCSET